MIDKQIENDFIDYDKPSVVKDFKGNVIDEKTFKKTFKTVECRSCEYTVGVSEECETCDGHNNYSELWDADENCIHDLSGGNGVKCRKCKGWFCF